MRTFTIVHHAAHRAVEDEVPYVIALIELTEGPRVIANLLHTDPESVNIGAPVRLTFREIDDTEFVLPQFELDIEQMRRTASFGSAARGGEGTGTDSGT